MRDVIVYKPYTPRFQKFFWDLQLPKSHPISAVLVISRQHIVGRNLLPVSDLHRPYTHQTGYPSAVITSAAIQGGCVPGITTLLTMVYCSGASCRRPLLYTAVLTCTLAGSR